MARTDLLELVALGYASKLFRDDATALKLENELLIPWRGLDKGPLVDRFDVLNLLDSLPETFNEPGSPEPEELDYERYRDLLESSSDEEDVRHPVRSGAAVPFEYPSRSVDEMELKGPSEKQLEVIRRTAKFIASSADPMKAEITIQAKRASDPLFAFLSVRDPLFATFKEHLDAAKSEAQLSVAQPKTTVLGIAYGSSTESESDDESDDEADPLLADVARQAATDPKSAEILGTKHLNDPRFSFLDPKNARHSLFLQAVAGFKTDQEDIERRIEDIADNRDEKSTVVSDSVREERLRKAREFLARKKASVE